MGRPGFCNVCVRPCSDLNQVGARCYYPDCGQGEFVHRRYWSQALCACGGGGGNCPWCLGSGFIAIPSEDPAVYASGDPVVTPSRPSLRSA